MSKLTIHGFAPSSFVRTVRLVAHERGLDYELLPPASDGDAAHPYRRMPLARRGDVVVYESLAIATWFDAIGTGPSLIPSDPLERARMHQWVSVVCDYFVGTISADIILPRFGIRAVPEEDVQAALKRVPDLWRPLEVQLGSSRYLAGESLSLADLFAMPILFYMMEIPELRAIAQSGWPSLQRWARDMGQRESVKATDPMPALRQLTVANKLKSVIAA